MPISWSRNTRRGAKSTYHSLRASVTCFRANPLVGGRTPILSPKEFEQLGFNAICFGLEPIMHAAKAIKIVLEDNSYRAALPLQRATRLASGTAQPCTCRPIVWALSL